MLRRLPLPPHICSILRVFVALGAALAGGGLACSEGESGLILGRPLPEVSDGVPGGGGTPGAEAGGGGRAPSAGGAPTPNGGQAPSAGNGNGDAGAGAAGAPAAEDPAWIAEHCTPGVLFENRDTTDKGQLFTDAAPEPAQLVWAATRATCRALYRAAEEVRAVPEVSLIVEDYAGIAGTSGVSMHISTNYLQSASDRGVDLAQEIAGILHFTSSLVYQNTGDGTAPGWLVTGIADFVRLRAGLLDTGAPTKGGNYDDSSRTTALFLEHLTERNPDIVPRLNQRLAPEAGAWSDDAFVSLMGSDLPTLWGEYQATLP